MDNPIVLFGLPIPDSSPLFLTILAVHVVTGMVSVIAGALAMLSKKKHGRHDRYGTVYYRGLVIIFITALFLSVMRWPEDNHLFVLGALSFLTAFIGRIAHRRLWKKWPVWHLVGMGSSYILMLTAFYVDNGKNLPLWNLLPESSYWFIPGIIGIPLIIIAFIRNPLMKSGK